VPAARSSLGSPATDVPDRRALIHRRRRNLLAGALAAFAIGIAVGAMSGDEEGSPAPVTPAPNRAVPPASEPDGSEGLPVDGLSLAQQVGQLIVLRFAGTTPPDDVREALRERRVAGVILFRDNVADPTQLRALTRALRRSGGRPIIAVDQEGGEIRIVPWAPPAAAAPEQEAAGSVRADAEAAGAALRGLGITVSLAPVGDVPSVAGAALGGRAFATEPDAVREAMAAAAQGWRAGGVAATAKHFPGLGGAAVNTDDGSATIERSRAQLEATDLPSFAAAIEAGVPLVMVGHARYPALDPDRIASQSEPIIQQLLRERMGFRGVVVTDSMEARASLATGAITTVSERAVRAGADLLLLTGRGSYTPVYEHLLSLARRTPGFRARVRESAARVLALKRDAASP
jgi:beta-N-acetylhexosaminidase